MTRLPLLFVVIATIIATASAQFGNIFDQFFGHHGQQQQQQQQAHGGVEWYKRQHEAGNCPLDKYVCPDTMACVDAPKDCPCRFAGETKCVTGKGSYVCLMGGGGVDVCKEVQEE
ncbi:hypothetical protein SAICODRAFT_213520 [Saitoella complicata NRRL Y-17804]|uniref:uncharacterized protein n=1 Tax=Saitoella complicata (strain BCRC 22490 / CBS 7301 / JCM 7358 / NBRC 10748 / NRRL Y-17804) TaxID=698492 RepID=UPI000867CA42|nr:uncharacterized protein SAICODRAFT_213520 [Saitoella complicata NRRL Y-17804]ODQ54075.1 hypothetical protein SAICODRAFT_213520 [Saitoella complicata NRRL Y-17804]